VTKTTNSNTDSGVWSYSRLKEAEKCPKAFMERYIKRSVPYVEGEAQRYGNEVHRAMQLYIGHGRSLPEHLRQFSHFGNFDLTDREEIFTELELGITRENKHCGFYADDCFFRGKVDLVLADDKLACLFDWKTGKPYEDDDELQLHAMLVKARFPEVKHWRGWFVWLRENRLGQEHTLSPGKTFGKLVKRVEALDITDDTPRKNNLCPWCPVASCKHFQGGQGR
jgi:hypothetical protein